MRELVEPFGPDYPDLGATVAKLRRKAADSCIVHRKVYQREHGLAVLAAISAKNKAALAREGTTAPKPWSGSCRSNGERLLKALQAQHLNSCNPDTIRAKRTPAEWHAMYEAAMADKRKRESHVTP